MSPKKKVIQFILYRGFIFQLVSTDLKKIGWSVKDGADASFSFPSSLPDVEKPLWLKRLWAGTEMMGAGSWLLMLCLEKLQEISGAAAFFVETQTAEQNIIIKSHYMKVKFTANDLDWMINVTFLSRRWEKLNFSSKTSKEVLQEE